MILTIEGLSAGGRGVARHDGRVWFVAHAVPGDQVRPLVIRQRDRFVEATVAERVQSSGDRRTPACSYQASCGGCPWMVLPEPEQRFWRRRMVVDALERIGGLDAPIVEEVTPAPMALGYRNRAELALGLSPEGVLVLGFRGYAGEIVDLHECKVLPDRANSILVGLRQILLDRKDPELIAALKRTRGFRIGIRTSSASGELMVALYETAVPFPRPTQFARAIRKRHPEVRGVVRVRSVTGRRGGATVDTLDGEGSIMEVVSGLRFQLPAATFLQVNPDVGEILIHRVRELAGEVAGKVVLDLYGGVGVFGLTLAELGARVFVVEADRAAVKCGRKAAELQGLVHVRFRHGEVLRFLQARAISGGAADVVVADPPRTGLGRGVAAAIAQLRPRRIVLVSCDPATGGRDIKMFGEFGFKPQRVVPMDMFPQTAHVEIVTLLKRDPNVSISDPEAKDTSG